AVLVPDVLALGLGDDRNRSTLVKAGASEVRPEVLAGTVLQLLFGQWHAGFAGVGHWCESFGHIVILADLFGLSGELFAE
ncbi:MAG: hypothetical protein RJA45_685, partial [Actinomycetota bacterium]